MAIEGSYYELLAVEKHATHDEIRQAFKKVVLTKHPDRGGKEEEFIALQKAYEVLSDARRRRIYDRYGTRGLEQSAEALFTEDFRGGSFAAGPEEIAKEVSELRKENASLQKALMLVRPETVGKQAGSYEAWLRNRDPGANKVLTANDLIGMGISEAQYDAVKLPQLASLGAQLVKDGPLADAVTVRASDGPEALGWGEVLVHMLVAPITSLDRHVAKWNFVPGEEPQPVRLPSPIGSEGVGMVVALGPGVEGLAVHDFVLPKRPNSGTWRRLAVFSAAQLFRVPPTSASPEAIANFHAYATAYCLLRDYGDLKPGDTIIQSSAETAIGQTVIALAKLLQIKTINLINPRDDFDELADKLQAKGATLVWKNDGSSIVERIKRSRLAMPRLGIDDQGGSTLTRIAECLRPDSTLVTHGATTSKMESFPYAALLYRNLEIRGFWVFRHIAARPDDFANLAHLVLPLLEQDTIDIDTSLWEKLEEALPAALADQHPNVLLKFGTTDDAVALAKELAPISAAPVRTPSRELPGASAAGRNASATGGLKN